MLRDILAGKAPFVLYKDIYASAAIAGACIYYFMYTHNVKTSLAVTTTILITILIRLFASYYHLGLPKIPTVKILSDENNDIK